MDDGQGRPPRDARDRQVQADRACIDEAATAVAAALRPALFDAVRSRAVAWPGPEAGHDVAAVLRGAMEGAWHQERTVPFWAATGPQLTAALVVLVRDLDEATASHLVGAALHAHILGRADTAPDAILRLAERAACWRQGHAAGHSATRP